MTLGLQSKRLPVSAGSRTVGSPKDSPDASGLKARSLVKAANQIANAGKHEEARWRYQEACKAHPTSHIPLKVDLHSSNALSSLNVFSQGLKELAHHITLLGDSKTYLGFLSGPDRLYLEKCRFQKNWRQQTFHGRKSVAKRAGNLWQGLLSLWIS